ncbi:hypothetical protein BurJ1DRAFT_2619 [Burkholderiales bacterium JOSHI_001]|nr:hypothetical protein BurJ1DRAFT_2619 [Burkholderiales bacterium JOSHI_001]
MLQARRVPSRWPRQVVVGLLALAFATAGLAGSGLPGQLWYLRLAGDETLVAPADGRQAERVLARDSRPVPWPDGSQYLEYRRSGGAVDQVLVKDTRSGRVLHSADLPGLCVQFQPSPLSKSIVMAQCYRRLLDNKGIFVVVDLAAQRLLHSEPDQPRRHRYRWLPDGRWLRSHDETGRLSVRASDGAWQPLGQLRLPPGTRTRDIRVSPNGDRLAFIVGEFEDYESEKPKARAHLWTARLDGSQQVRVIADNATFDVRWSPDGRALAFNVDTSHCDFGDNCHGNSGWWTVDAEEHGIAPVVADARHAKATPLMRRFPSGNSAPLRGVDLLAWTR